MDSVSQPLNDLRTFRDSLYRCFERRADALFELTDTLFTAAGTVPSPVHLSLVPAHRRGWGSLYAALSRGHIEGGPLGELLARHASAGEASRVPVYAVDVSVWSGCDAETNAVHVRLTMRRFTLLLASALVVGFGGTACGVGHFAYVGFASRSLNKCLVLPWLSDLVAK